MRAEKAGLDPRGSRSTIFTSARADCRRPSPSSATSPHRPRASASAPASSRCRWRVRCGWRRTPRCSICSATARFELGVGTGGNPSAFAAFGLDSTQRNEIFARNLDVVRTALAGKPLAGGDALYPQRGRNYATGSSEATFSVAGGARAGKAGDGLLLSRTQPRTKEAPRATLAEIKNPVIDAYLEALPPGREPRIMASRSVFVADDRREAMRLADIGLRRALPQFLKGDHPPPGETLEEMITAIRHPCGAADDVIASLGADATLERVTDLVFQAHSVDAPHPLYPALDRLRRGQGRASPWLDQDGAGCFGAPPPPGLIDMDIIALHEAE